VTTPVFREALDHRLIWPPQPSAWFLAWARAGNFQTPCRRGAAGCRPSRRQGCRRSGRRRASDATPPYPHATHPHEYGHPPERTWQVSLPHTGATHVQTVANPCAHGPSPMCTRPPAHTHTATRPYAYGHPPICIRPPCRMHTAALPCAYGGAAVCAWRRSRVCSATIRSAGERQLELPGRFPPNNP
jgi:hypothetical protein